MGREVETNACMHGRDLVNEPPVIVQRDELTIVDIARMAGVSRSTVSRVLTNHPRVSETARRAVEETLQRTGYRPSSVARSLRGRSSLVAVVVPSISTIFYAELVRGVESALAGEYTLAVVSTDDDPDMERRAVEQLRAARVGGLVISTYRHQSQDLFPREVPVVFVNRAPREPRHSVVTSDNFRGGYLATTLLVQSGHRKIGHVSASLSLPTSLERHEGYLKALRDAGIEPDPAWSCSGDISLEFGLEVGRRWVDENAEITGFFADNDIVAIGVMESLWRAGLAVPRDMSVVGYDDSQLAALTPFAVTSVRTPRRLLGELAGQLIKEAVDAGQAAEPRRIVLPVELVKRASVGRPRPRARLMDRLRHSAAERQGGLTG